MRWRVVFTGLAVVVAGCASADTAVPEGGVASGLVSVPAVVGEVLEPLDAECQSVAFSDGTMFWAMGGVIWESEDDFVTDSDGRVLQAVTWVDTPCGEHANRSMERVTTGWFEVDDNPEYWSEMEIVGALDHAAGDGLQLTRSCYVDEAPWPTVVALVNAESAEIESAWLIDEEGQLSETDTAGIACYEQEFLP